MKSVHSLFLVGLLAASQVQAEPVYFLLSGKITSGGNWLAPVGSDVQFRFSLEYPAPHGDSNPSAQIGNYFMWSGPEDPKHNDCLGSGGCSGTVKIFDNSLIGGSVYDQIGIDYTHNASASPGVLKREFKLAASIALPAVLDLITSDALLDEFSWVAGGAGPHLGSMTYTVNEWGGSPGYSRTYISQLELTGFQFGSEPFAEVPLPGAVAGFSGALALLGALRRRSRRCGESA